MTCNCNNNHKGEGKKVKDIARVIAGSWGSIATGSMLAGNLMSGNYTGSLIQAALLAPSLYGLIKGSKGLAGKGLNLKKPHKYLSNKIISKHKLINWMKKHKDNLPMNINQLKISKKNIKKILSKIEGDGYQGQGFKKLSKKVKNARQHIKKFFRGEEDYKPSDLLNHISTATGVASVFIPEMAIPTIAAKLGSKYLQSKGKGVNLPGGDYSSHGSGLLLAGYGDNEINNNKSVKKIPKKHKSFIQKNKKLAKKIAGKIVKGSAIAIPLIGSSLALYKYLYKNRGTAMELYKSPDDPVFQLSLSGIPGSGIKLAGERSRKYYKGDDKYRRDFKGGKIKRVGNKKDVWNGLAKQTSGGLKKVNLMKNKRGKIVSIKQHNSGKRMYSKNKHMLKQFK